MRRPLQGVLAALGLLGALVLSAPGGAGTEKTPRPRVAFVASSQTGPDRTFSVRLSSFRLTTAGLGKRATRGRGHIHFALDGGRFDRSPHVTVTGALAKEATAARGRYTPSARPRITYRGLPQGRHTLVATLVDSLHRRVGTPARTAFTVAQTGPPTIEFGPVPVCPCGLPAVPTTYTFVLKLANFTLSADGLGQRAAQGVGHVHFVMDGGRLDIPAHNGSNYSNAPAALAAEAARASGSYSPSVRGSFTYANMASGHHVLRASLVDNMDRPVGVSAELEFDVQ
jgi:hypothetical protein